MKRLKETYEGRPCKKHGHTVRYAGGNCVECSRETGTRTRDRHRQSGYIKARDFKRRLKAVYGLTLEEYDALHVAQKGGCAVCGGPPGALHERFCVDHDHDTGEVRGLLCHHCNTGIGHFRDDPLRLELAAVYLREHGRF